VYRNKVLHHGTLLYNTNLEMLNEVLLVKPGIYFDKSVRSIRSRVENIVNLTPEKISLAGFRDLILEHISRNARELGFYKLSEADISGINDLVENKYKTWKWNFGYSPNYIFKNKIVHRGREYEIELEVEKGIIIDCKMTTIKGFSENLIHVNKLLTGIKHDYNSLREQIYLLNQKEEKPIFDPDILMELLFLL
jgi:lipoate-protein ligase A